MGQQDIDALVSIRSMLVAERRAAATAADAATVIRIQHDLALVDAAILDEQSLGQHEKDELAINRAMRREPDGSKLNEISLVDDPIRVAD